MATNLRLPASNFLGPQISNVFQASVQIRLKNFFKLT